MKISEVREMSTSELKEKLYSLKEQLFEFARVNMVLRERELESK